MALLKLPEVAAELRTPEATLRYWRHVGKGPRSFKLGRAVVYEAGDVAQWLEEQRVAG
jgi:predicted DNA-binding transcriptional regulator AlpA